MLAQSFNIAGRLNILFQHGWLHECINACLQVQPAFVLMSDPGGGPQSLFTEERGPLVEQLMQASAMHHLSNTSSLPVAYMTNIKFQQVLLLHSCTCMYIHTCIRKATHTQP